MDRKPEILILCLADPSGNPRPRRMAEFCRDEGCNVSIAGFPRSSALECNHYYEFRRPSLKLGHRIMRKAAKLGLLLFKTDIFEEMLSENRWRLDNVTRALKDPDFDIIIVEDIHLLPFAFKIKKQAKIIFDAREYYPLEFDNSLLWRLTERPHRLRICRKFLSRCDEILTVSPGLAARYQKEFGVSPHLLRSTPGYVDMRPSELNRKKIRMVHHGGANKDRRLESMIELFAHLDDRFSLDFYLTGNALYLDRLKRKAEKFPQIRFLDPVPFEKIIPTIHNYDIGLYLLAPTSFNTTYALPNKLFEFIQGRLAVAIGPSPNMADIVRKYQCGFVSESFEPKDMADMLNGLSAEDIIKAKKASDVAAKELCYEREIENIRPLLGISRSIKKAA